MEFRVADKLSEVQIPQLVELYQGAWWAEGRTIDEVREMLAHTDYVFAFVAPESDDLLAFVRVLTDRVYLALILDVIVAPSCRGQGLGRRLVETIQDHPVLAKVQNLELCCLDEMKPFYRKLGFTEAKGRMQIKRKQ